MCICSGYTKKCSGSLCARTNTAYDELVQHTGWKPCIDRALARHAWVMCNHYSLCWNCNYNRSGVYRPALTPHMTNWETKFYNGMHTKGSAHTNALRGDTFLLPGKPRERVATRYLLADPLCAGRHLRNRPLESAQKQFRGRERPWRPSEEPRSWRVCAGDLAFRRLRFACRRASGSPSAELLGC